MFIPDTKNLNLERRSSIIIYCHNALQLSNIPLHYHYIAITLTLRSHIYPILFASLHFSFLGFGWKRVAINSGPKNPKDLLKKRRHNCSVIFGHNAPFLSEC
ncbi:hypothetical protein TNCV_157081 [Trichonephila clavipes]|nr:hypothetical protein TNCV_157081 [Trichonephila clavipes]